MFPPESHFIIVEDSSAVRELVKGQLSKLGYKNVLEAEDGSEALDKLDNLQLVGGKIHLMIVDWNMPQMNGIELLSVLKKDSKYQDIPFLMITSESDSQNVIKAIVMGVTDYIVKPFDEAILSEKLSAIWKRLNKKSK